MRRILTPKGLFIYDRNSGLCAFTPEVKSKTWTKPLYAQIAVTLKCNQKCWWCYSSSSPEKAQSWPLEKLKEIIGFLDSWGILGVAFGGGEPFVYPHLDKIAMWTWSHTGLDISVTTNGTAASEERINRLEGYVTEVRVSIRNPEACRLLKKFLDKRFELGVNLLLFRGNTPVLESIVDRSMRLGVRDFLVNSFIAVGRGATYKDREPKREDLVKLDKVIQKFRDEATFRVSGRLAANLKASADLKFIPFEDAGRGRIIAVTADRKVKPSSLS
ncbi:MAG: radical SAM protein [Candidatus Bathyarchaeia archaeon]